MLDMMVMTAVVAIGSDPPVGPHEVTMLEQSRVLSVEFFFGDPQCVDESSSIAAPDFGPFSAGSGAGSYDSTLLTDQSNQITGDFNLIPGGSYCYPPPCSCEYCCDYAHTADFELRFRIDRAHVLYSTGASNSGSIYQVRTGDDLPFFDHPESVNKPLGTLVPPGEYILRSGLWSWQDPLSDFKTFDIWLAVHNHPLDADGSGVIDAVDLAGLLAAWGECDDPEDCDYDADEDGVVGAADLSQLLAEWGELNWLPGQPF